MDEKKIVRLMAAAKKASPGPWKLTKRKDAFHGADVVLADAIVGQPAPNTTFPAKIVDCGWGAATKRGVADYNFISLCNPQTIIELIEAVRAK